MQQRPGRRAVEVPAYRHCHGIGDRGIAAAGRAESVDDQVAGQCAFDRPECRDHRRHAGDGKGSRQALDAAVDDGRLVARGVAGRQHDEARPQGQRGDLRSRQQAIVQNVPAGARGEYQGRLGQSWQFFPDQAVRGEVDDVEFRQRLQAEVLFGRRLSLQQPSLGLVEQTGHALDLFGCFGQFLQRIQTATQRHHSRIARRQHRIADAQIIQRRASQFGKAAWWPRRH